jgi:prepilin-type N-terminal cleavage/methylation domain-containing protein
MRRRRESGFTLVEMIVVSMLLAIAMLGLLAVFDASARINKNETDVADAQGAVRYGIYQLTRVIRMAGAGGLFVTQAVLNHNDRGLTGIAPAGASYDNVSGVTVTDTSGTVWNVRDGTDMIEIRGVILSPLLGFDHSTGCTSSAPCTGSQSLTVRPIAGDPIIGQHVNNDNTQRPQFAAIDAYTANAGTYPMFVLVEDGDSDLHSACSDPTPGGVTRYPQPIYNVGVITAQTQLAGSNSFGTVDFGGALAPRFNGEMPSGGGQAATPSQNTRRAGILDDIVFFVTTDPANDPTGLHPILMQGIRRGAAFEVTRLAEDVEDMQVAYGVDTNGDNAITRNAGCAPSVNDPDPNFSTANNCDEWFPNTGTETPLTDVDFQAQNPFIPAHSGTLSTHCPRLHGVMISLLAKSKDPDPTYHGPAAQGYQIMNSTAASITPGNYRRRVQTLKVNLRNYAFQG